MDSTLSWSLVDLPASVLLRSFTHLSSHKDVLALQSTCKYLYSLGHSHHIWLDRFKKEHGLRLQVTEQCEEKTLQKLFRKTQTLYTDLRFWGVFTDGGCDEERLTYWVDNAFMPNHWDSFCSELGNNVNCIGILIGQELERDTSALAERNYIIQRCKYAASQILADSNDNEDVGKQLQSWSTPELSNLLLTLYNDFVMDGVAGRMLFAEVPAPQLLQERNRLNEFVQNMKSSKRVLSAGIIKCHPEDITDAMNELDLSLPDRETKHEDRVYLYDTAFTELYQSSFGQEYIGIIDSMSISRKGAFSCPVAYGCLFIGQMNLAEDYRSQGEIVDILKKMCMDQTSTNFDDLVNIQAVENASKEGKLPNISNKGKVSNGHWVEFDHMTMKAKKLQNDKDLCYLRPVVWFHFYSTEEIQKMEQEHETVELGNAADLGLMEYDYNVDPAPHHMNDDLDDFDDEGSVMSSVSNSSTPSDMDMMDIVAGEDFMNIGEGLEQALLEDLDPQDDGDGEVVQISSSETSPLVIPLMKSVGGNIVLLKLISPENRMSQFADDHSDPNIDISSITFSGKKALLPKGVHHC